MELVCNLTFKGVKELKHQKGRKGLEYVWFDEEGKPDSFDDCILQKNLTKCFTQEYFRSSGLVPSPKIYLFKLLILKNFIKITSKMQQIHQSLFILECLLYKYLLDLSGLEF